MSMVSKVKGAGNSVDIPNLDAGDYLKRETQNEKAAAMIIVKGILKQFGMSMAKVEKELSSRPDNDWNSPGDEIDLKFLEDFIRHTGV